MSAAGLVIEHPGVFTSVQDLGRPGLARIGVGTSGAADRGSLRLANRLVGNDEWAAGLEVTLGGLRLRAQRDLVVAVTGAPCRPFLDRREEGLNAVLRVPRGSVLSMSQPDRGLRSYVAVRGGIDVPPVLGSRATDVLAQLGPSIPTAGTTLPVGPAPPDLPFADLAPTASIPRGDTELEVVLGPRDDWFTEEAVELLLREPFTVSTDSNRIGMRLDGPPLRRRAVAEIPSEGTVLGSIQCPPRGRPTLFLADHPVTGGYPVIAVVVSTDVDRAAQIRPGQHVRFRRHRPCGR